MLTQNQELAADIFTRVQSRGQNEDKDQYGAMAHKLPVLIRTAGLAQALGFVEARGGDAHKKLLQDLKDTLRRPNLSADSRNAPLPEYLRLTRETLAALLWYKRFAQSVLDVAPGTQTDTEVE